MGTPSEKNPSAAHLCCIHWKKISKTIIFIVFVMLVSYMYHSKIKIPEIMVPSPSTTQVPKKQATAMFPYLIEEKEKCTSGPPFLLLLIPSRPEEIQARNVLRKTWANETLMEDVHITRLFLLGRPTNNENGTQENVIQESSMFHDIIQQDFMDSYNNLTLKTLMGMEWIGRLCPGVSYVMKIDTDMFFNPWFLVEKILQPKSPPKVNFFTGLMVNGAPPYRNKDNKWYVPFEIYSKNAYPPYCSGTGYLFSGDLAEKIYAQAKGISLFPFEDVFVGMCLERIGIQIYKPEGNWFIGEKMEYSRCQFTKLITVHRFTPDELLKLWPDFTEAVKTCS